MGKQEEIIDIDSIVTSLLSEIPSHSNKEVTLPSGGIAKIRPITFEEEKEIIRASKTSEVDVASIILDKCVDGIEKSEILLVDKLYLLFKLRELSFGAIYDFVVGCPGCKRENNISVDLNNMPVVSLENEDGTELVDLPMCKKTAVVKLASVADEKFMRDTEQLMDNLWRFIIKFDEYDNEMVIQSVLKKLPAGDITKIVNAVTCKGYGLTTEVRVICSHCGNDTVMELPLNQNFFSVS
jgi:hypothetical protein